MSFVCSCENCIFSSIYDYQYAKEKIQEIYCDCESCKQDDGNNIVDGYKVGAKCAMFKSKHIISHGDTFSITEHYGRGKYICCESNDFHILNRFINKDRLYLEIMENSKKVKELNSFLSFIKSELPDVYKRLWKEFCNTRNSDSFNEEEAEKSRYDTNGEMLKTGESQRPDGRYRYTWRADGKQQEVCALTLAELREKECEIQNGK